MEHQTLGRRFVCPIDPATQREFILDWRILRVGNSGTTIQHPKKWVVGSKIWHLRKSVKTKFVGIKRLDWNYFMLFFDISKFLDPPLTFLDVVSLFLNCPLLIMSGVFLNIFFLIITSNLEPWSDSFVTFYDLAL